jgi:penicillin-insensitive murein endopeptidase
MASGTESICYGTVSKGRLEGGVKLPSRGNNFAGYSSMAAGLGRTYVHSKVRQVVVAAYQAVERTAPNKTFVYGETGWAAGGRLRPHRTHQNGLSVDFMVPVLDKDGRSVPLPASPTNKFGYSLEFDVNGVLADYRIDFDAVAEHLYQLHTAAKAQGVGLALVIFDPPFLPKLFATSRGAFLQENINFMKGKAWVRHDEHYHVDFAVPCKPIAG